MAPTPLRGGAGRSGAQNGHWGRENQALGRADGRDGPRRVSHWVSTRKRLCDALSRSPAAARLVGNHPEVAARARWNAPRPPWRQLQHAPSAPRYRHSAATTPAAPGRAPGRSRAPAGRRAGGPTRTGMSRPVALRAISASACTDQPRPVPILTVALSPPCTRSRSARPRRLRSRAAVKFNGLVCGGTEAFNRTIL